MKSYLFLLFIFGAIFSNTFSAPIRVKVEVNPNVELMSVIHLLSGIIKPDSSPYMQEVIQFFSPLKNHEAVRKLKKLIKNRKHSQNIDLIRYGNYFTPPPEFRLAYPFSPIDSLALESMFDMAEVQQFLHACSSFAKVSHFMEFFQKHQPLYAAWSGYIARQIQQDKSTIPILENFFGDKTQPNWRLWICPLVNHFRAQALSSGLKINYAHVILFHFQKQIL